MPAGERMDVLDVLRGVAVSAILLVNIGPLSGHDFIGPERAAALSWAAYDPASAFLRDWLVTGKFYCLFSFLFGVGFSVFIHRAEARGVDAIRRFKRRLTGLLIIGLVHTLFIWYGDILVLYAVLGVPLILFVRNDDASVLRWAFGMLAMPVAIYAVLLVLASIAFAFIDRSAAGGPVNEFPPILARAADGFASGSYVDVVIGNAVFTGANAARRLALMFFPRVFGMFLLGLYAGRRGIFADLDANAPLFGRLFRAGLLVGLPLAYAGAYLGTAPNDRPVRTLLHLIVESIATPALTLAYGAGLCLLFRRSRAPLNMLAPAGRMALTNYLVQSIVGVVIFYGIGFGQYGRVSLTVLLVGSLAFCVVQSIVSRIWLAFAAYGPAEWAWRMFTYGRRLPLRRTNAAGRRRAAT